MKKLFSLVLIALVAFVVGCNQNTGEGGAAGGATTNAPAAP